MITNEARAAWRQWWDHGDAEDARTTAAFVPSLCDEIERLRSELRGNFSSGSRPMKHTWQGRCENEHVVYAATDNNGRTLPTFCDWTHCGRLVVKWERVDKRKAA